MSQKNILNASEHLFNLSFSETLMLRNYSRINNLDFCSMIGGPESIRDIQEARNLFANSLDFQTIESFFAIEKICSAIAKVFKNKEEIDRLILIINISTPDGIKLIDNIQEIKISEIFSKSNFVFNFDRRLISRNILNIDNDSFNYEEYENKINPLIYKYLNKLNSHQYKTCISGGITEKSIITIYKNIVPDFIKTGLFTINAKDYLQNELQKKVIYFQKLEDKLLRLMRDSVYYRYSYLDKRQNHLNKYLIGK